MPTTAPQHEHALQVYEDDRDRVNAVATYLSDGFVRGDDAIVFATPEHQQALERALTARGLDLSALESAGALTIHPARETLDTFLRNDGTLDTAIVTSLVTSLFGQVRSRARTTRVYGEMVTLLWADGNVASALELETLWTDAVRQIDASVFCAYPTSLMNEAPHTALAGLYDVHGEILGRSGPQEGDVARTAIEETFAAEPGSPAAARAFVAEALNKLGYEHLVEEAALVVSELATNAILHARSPFVVGVAQAADTARIIVQDGDSTAPLFAHGGAPDESGRGLVLVDAMASRWGVRRHADGKTVWVDLAS